MTASQLKHEQRALTRSGARARLAWKWESVVPGPRAWRGAAWGGAWLLDDGSPAVMPPRASTAVGPLDMPDPSQPGPYNVRTLTYGSGDDRHRPEYGVDADLVTAPVDGSALADAPQSRLPYTESASPFNWLKRRIPEEMIS